MTASGSGEDRTDPGEGFLMWLNTSMEAWTGRADLKASILLAAQGAVFVFMATGAKELFSAGAGWPRWVAVAAAGVLVVAMCLVAAAVMPVLGSARSRRAGHAEDVVFFGHVRMWRPEVLAQWLSAREGGQRTLMLARHLVGAGRITWRKYRLLQVSVVLTVAAVVLLAAAVFAGA